MNTYFMCINIFRDIYKKKPFIFAFILSGLMFTMKEMFEGKKKSSLALK